MLESIRVFKKSVISYLNLWLERGACQTCNCTHFNENNISFPSRIVCNSLFYIFLLFILDNDLHLGDALGGGEYSLVSLNTRGFFSFIVFS